MYVKKILPENHLKTIIILHGLNHTNLDEIVSKINKKRGVKILIPIAKKILIKWPDSKEEEAHSWYNYYTRYDNMIKHDIINLPEFNKNSESIKNLIEQESKIIDPSKIYLCGISQGGTIAINVGLQLNFKINRIICVDTIFLHCYFDYRIFGKSSQKFSVLQSKNDTVYNPQFQDHCYAILKRYNYEIDKKILDSEHTESMEQISDFIVSNIA